MERQAYKDMNQMGSQTAFYLGSLSGNSKFLIKWLFIHLAGHERSCSNSGESHEEEHTYVSKMLFS
ncbi:hypothetical protein H5410_024329 [Solanum commersonii]|uniref:Uncharacterized protein n=1 Tax=Solanum commersonii TaxID=4109 RepID=A0A9J5ZLP3_SOLCO|nr:hypothetical protein H5410_024329 [Solanum commersonii]